MGISIVDGRSYIEAEMERINVHQWELGCVLERPVSPSEAIQHFSSQPYDHGLTPRDWFHIDAVKSMNEHIARGNLPLDYPFFHKVLSRASESIDLYWKNVGLD
jgi:hypothetical protein